MPKRHGPSRQTGRLFFRWPPTEMTFPSVTSASTAMLKIALPNKGRLAEDTRELFEDAGLPIRARGERALTASLGGEFEAIFVRAQDIPEFVADGAADAGITGWDLVCESGRELDVRLDLELRTVPARRRSTRGQRHPTTRRRSSAERVATVFPRVTRRFFERPRPPGGDRARIRSRGNRAAPWNRRHRRRPDVDRIDAQGERASRGGDGARVDGAPRHAHVDAHAIDAAKRRALDELAAALESVLRARGQRYVMANVPRAALDRVKEVLPGLNGPTVIDILNGGAARRRARRGAGRRRSSGRSLNSRR